MKIKTLVVNAPFQYLWLKNVKDVDLEQHCAKCLIGQYDSRINNKQAEYKDYELMPDIYYLCGVSKPYVWRNNFHLAFKYQQGSRINVTRNNIHIEIEDAVELPINQDYIVDHSKGPAYYTCRNWQFANYFKYIEQRKWKRWQKT